MNCTLFLSQFIFISLISNNIYKYNYPDCITSQIWVWAGIKPPLLIYKTSGSSSNALRPSLKTQRKTGDKILQIWYN